MQNGKIELGRRLERKTISTSVFIRLTRWEISTFHLSSGHVGTGLVLERDPGVDGAALQAGGGGPAGAPPEVIGEVLRPLDGTPDGVGVHSEESVERGVARDGPAEAGQANLRSGAAGQC